MRLAMSFDCRPSPGASDRVRWDRARAITNPDRRARPRMRRSGLKTLRNIISSVGAEGPIAFLVGLIWLLYILDFSLPWYSIFPLTMLVGGGAFIIANITYQAESDVPEVLRDRCDH